MLAWRTASTGVALLLTTAWLLGADDFASPRGLDAQVEQGRRRLDCHWQAWNKKRVCDDNGSGGGEGGRAAGRDGGGTGHARSQPFSAGAIAGAASGGGGSGGGNGGDGNNAPNQPPADASSGAPGDNSAAFSQAQQALATPADTLGGHFVDWLKAVDGKPAKPASAYPGRGGNGGGGGGGDSFSATPFAASGATTVAAPAGPVAAALDRSGGFKAAPTAFEGRERIRVSKAITFPLPSLTLSHSRTFA